MCYKVVLLFVLAMFGPVVCFESFDRPPELRAAFAKIDLKIQEENKPLLDTLTQETKSRSKRAAIYEEYDDLGFYSINDLRPLPWECDKPIDLTLLEHKNCTYGVCIQKEYGQTFAKLSMIYPEFKSLYRWKVNSPKDVVAFSSKDKIFMVVADEGRGIGQELVWYDTEKRSPHHSYNITSYAPTALAVWTMSSDGLYHIAVANSPGTNGYFRNETYIAKWKDTYFDQYATITTYDVKDLEPFHIHSTAYIAVANHRLTSENYDVHSEIFKYDIHSNSWKSFQKIRTYAAMDCEFFRFGHGATTEFFLALANNFKMIGNTKDYNVYTEIYKLEGSIFRPLHYLKTLRATSIASYRGPQDEFLLAVSSEIESMKLYQYDGFNFIESDAYYNKYPATRAGISHMYYHMTSNSGPSYKPILAVANPLESGPVLYECSFVKEEPSKEWSEEKKRWCTDTLDEVSKLNVHQLKEQVKDFYYIDQKEPIVIEHDLRVERGKVEKLATKKLIDRVEDKTHDHNIIDNLVNLKSQIDYYSQAFEDLNELLDNALRYDKEHQKVTGEVFVDELVLNCDEEIFCIVSKIDTIYLNGQHLDPLLENIVYIDKDLIINDHLEVGYMNVSYDMFTEGLVNGIDPKRFVSSYTEKNISGKVIFNVPYVKFANDFTVKNTFNGMEMRSQNFILNDYDQEFDSLVINDMEAYNLQTDLVNGANVQALFDDLVYKDRSNDIYGAKTFEDLTLEDINMSGDTLINGVNISDLWENAFWLNSNEVQSFKAPVNFTSLTVNNANVMRTINGLRIPGPQVLLVNESATIRPKTSFKAPVTINKLTVRTGLNDIRMIETKDGEKQLDLFLRNEDQFVPGEKIFKSAILGGASTASLVNGIDLHTLRKNLTAKHSSRKPDGDWHFTNVVFKGPLKVMKGVNGIDLNRLAHNTVKITDAVMPANLKFVFKNDVKIRSLECPDINGINFSRDLLRRNVSSQVKGKKTFESISLMADSFVQGHLNGIDSSFWASDTLMRYGDQEIRRKMTIKGDLHANEIVIDNLVNGIDLKKMVPLNKNVTISGPIHFHDLTVEGILHVSNLDVGSINDVNLNDLYSNTLTYDGEQTITGHKTIYGVLTLQEDCNLQTSYLNGINVSEFWNDVALIDTSQEIRGNLEFKGDVIIEDLIFTDTIDGITDWEMRNNWLLRDEDQEIKGDVAFFQDVKILQDLIVRDTINSVNLTALNSSIVKVDEPSEISGPLFFENPVYVAKNVSLTGKIQGIDLDKEAVLKSSPHSSIKGKKTFLQTIHVMENLWVDGLIDTVDVRKLCLDTLRVKGNQTVHGHTKISGDVVFENLRVNGLVNGMDLVFLNESCPKIDEDVDIYGHKTFNELIIRGHLEINGRLGEIDIVELNKTYLSKTRDQNIFGSMTFKSDLIIKGDLSVSNLTTSNGKVNKIDLKKLQETVLSKSKSQDVSANYFFEDGLVIRGNLHVNGEVGGLMIPDDLMQKNKDNVISSQKLFLSGIKVKENLSLKDGVKIQGVDLSEWAKDVVDRNKDIVIKSPKTFTNLIIKSNDTNIEGLVNGVRISKDTLLLTYGDQNISGIVIFNNDVVINNYLDLAGTINNYDLERVAKNAFRKDRDNSIVAPKYFLNDLNITSLSVYSPINNVDINQLQDILNRNVDLKYIKDAITKNNESLLYLQHVLDEKPVYLAYYEKIQEIFISEIFAFAHSQLPDGSHLLTLADEVDTDGCTSIHLFRSNHGESTFSKLEQKLSVSYAGSLDMATIDGEVYLFVANSKASCYKNEYDTDRKTQGLIYKWEIYEFRLFNTFEMEPSHDVKYFMMNDRNCVIWSQRNLQINVSADIYCKAERDFALQTEVVGFSSSKLSINANEGASLVFTTTVFTSTVLDNYTGIRETTEQSSLEAYEFDHKFESRILETRKDLEPITSIKQIYYKTPYSESHLLILGQKKSATLRNTLRIMKFELSNSHSTLDMYQEMESDTVLAIDYTLLPNRDLFLIVLTDSSSDNLKVYRHRGISKFVLEHSSTINGAQFMKIFKTDHMDNHFIFLSGHKGRGTVKQSFSTILKAKIYGKHYPYKL